MKRNKFQENLLLLKLKTKRDPETFGQIYDIYIDRIFRFIYFKVSSREDVEDLTSEVFLKTWQYLNGDKSVKNFNALIYQVARNLVIDYYRKNAKSDVIVDELIMQNIEDEGAKRAEKQLHADIDMQYVDKLLHKLKDEYREVILLRYIENYSLKEISLIIDKPVGSVKVLVHRALKKVRALHDEYGK